MDSVSNAIGCDEVGENVLGCLKLFNVFKVMKHRRNVVEVEILDQGFDEKVISLRCWVDVVEAKRTNESGEEDGWRKVILCYCY